MRVGRPVRESNLEGMMEERARVMRVRMVGEFDMVFSGAATGFLGESRLMFCDVEGLGVMGTFVSLGVNPDSTVCAVVGVADLKDHGLMVPRVVVAKPRAVLENPELVLPVGGQEQVHWGCLMHVTREGAVGARLPPHGG